LPQHLIEIEEGTSRQEQGRRAIRALLNSGEDFDAIFAVCDEIALGALHELTEQGLRVPEEVGLIGFDGIRASAHAMPPLSTIQPDFAAAGALLVDKLLATIAGEAHEQRRVPIQLLARASTNRR
jgi:DNA-binding LacI/PurR family transcriptional regulator